MGFDEISLNKVKNDELIEIYNSVKETIGFLENEINSNEMENK